jgi:hypothetical protein
MPVSVQLFGAFAKLRKATISFVMPPSVRLSVRPSVRPHGTSRLPPNGFSWNLIFREYFEKSVEKIQVSLRSDKNNGYFTRRSGSVYDSMSLNSSWSVKSFIQSCKENQNTHFMFNYFFSENRTVCEMWKNVLESEKPQMTTQYGACALHTG